MEEDDVVVGRHYVMRVHGSLTVVRLDNVALVHGGWEGTDLQTGRLVLVIAASWLLRVATPLESVEAQRAQQRRLEASARKRRPSA